MSACGAIRRPSLQRQVPISEQSVGGARREDPGAEQSASGVERQASRAKQFASGAKALSVDHGAIRDQRERKESSAERSASGIERQVLSAESNRRPAPGGRSGARSNLCEVEKAKGRAWSNSRTARTAKCGGRQLGTHLTERSQATLSDKCGLLFVRAF